MIGLVLLFCGKLDKFFLLLVRRLDSSEDILILSLADLVLSLGEKPWNKVVLLRKVHFGKLDILQAIFEV